MTSALTHTRIDDNSSKRNIYEELRHLVLLKADKARLDPLKNKDEITKIIVDVIKQHNENCSLLDDNSLVDETIIAKRLTDSIFGYGPLTEILNRDDIEEIFIEGARVSYIDTSGHLRGLANPTTATENQHVIERLLSATDRTLNVKTPLVQARILNGTARLSASISPISDHLSATIRKYVISNISLQDLAQRGSMSIQAAGFLWAIMQTRSRIIVSGEPGAGKTTLLSALLVATPTSQCVRCCEEIRELSVDFTHGGYYEVRPAGIDGTGEVTLRDLVKFTLAMRPDRIVCGEVRGAEAFELSRAINAGCGFACTIHSNNATDGLEALVNASLMAGENVSESIMRKIFSNAIDIVVHVDRDENPTQADGISRGIMEIVAVESSLSDTFTTTTLFSRSSLSEPLRYVGPIPEVLSKKIDKALPVNFKLQDILDGKNVFERNPR